MSVQDIYNKLRTAPEFHPASAELFDDFTIEAGDVISLQSDGENYALPVFAQRTVWNGSAMVTVQSQGDKERKPLPALQRKEYGRGRGYYQQQRETEDNFIRFNKFIEDTDERFSRLMTESEWDEAADQSVVTMWSQVTQTARAIESEVTRATSAESTLSSRITQEAGKIALVVSTTSQGNKVNAASITAAINESGNSSVVIEADKIVLSGETLTDTITALEGNFTNLTTGQERAQSILATLLNTVSLVVTSGTIRLGSADVTYCPISIPNVRSKAFLGTEAMDLGHYHKITATAGTGDDAGKIFLTLEETQASAGSANFNIADTQFYKDGVSAAYERGKQEGGAAPTIVSVVRDQTKNTTYASSIYTVPVIVTFSDGTTQDSTVNISISTGSYNADTKRYSINVAGSTDRSLDASAAFNAGANSKAFSSANIRGVNSAMYGSLNYSVLTVGGSKSSGYYSLAINYADGTTTFRKFTTV